MPPIVPVVDQTAMPDAQFTSPNVTPFRNLNPEQTTDLGQALVRTGTSAASIGKTAGDRLQDQVDNASAKAAENSFLAKVQPILYDPKDGYFRQEGKAAVDAYDGAKDQVVQAGNDTLATLNNPLQKQMFQQVMQQHLFSFGKSMADYNHTQSVAWSASESKARSDSYTMLALNASDSRYQSDDKGQPLGDFAKYTAQMEKEVLNSAALAGFDPDSAQAKAMLREQYTSLNQAMISKLLDNHDAAGAKKWFDEQSAKGNIDLRNQSVLGNAVKTEYDRQQSLDFVDKMVIPAVLSPGDKSPLTLAMPVPGSSINVTSGLGAARPDGRSHDGIDIAVPVGTQVLAPAGGKVLKVWNDDKFGGGLSVEMQLPNGYTAGFAHLSAANVREGDELQQGGAIGLSGKTGNATGPVLHYMMKDGDGKYVDPRQVSQPQPNAQGISDPTALSQGLQMIQQSDLSPEQKRTAQTYLESQHSHARSIADQQYEDVKQQATNEFYAAGGNYDAIKAQIRTQLRPEDVYKFQKGIPTENNADMQAAFVLEPKNQTVAWVQAHRMDFSKETYISYLTQANNNENSPDKEKNAALDANQMDDILAKNGMWNLAQPKSDVDRQAAVALKSRIMDQFVSDQNTTGKPLTRDRKAEIIRQTVGDQVSVHGFFWDSSNKPVVALTPSQMQNSYVQIGDKKVKLSAIPMQDQMQMTQALRSANMPVSQQSIADLWVKARNRKGLGVPTF